MQVKKRLTTVINKLKWKVDTISNQKDLFRFTILHVHDALQATVTWSASHTEMPTI